MEPLTVESAMQENTVTFEGHPADETIEAEEVTPEKVETPAEKVETPAEKVEIPTFKYKSQEAAEKAEKDAETLMHEATTKANRESERAEDLQKQINDLLVKPAEPELLKPNSTDRMKELLEQVNKLDPEDENYHLKVAEVWGKREDEIQTNIDAKVTEALTVYDKKAKEEQAIIEKELSTQKTILNSAEKAGKDAGLDMKKDSTDSDLFWAYADKAPEGSIEEQITWTIDKVKNIKAAYTPQLKSAEEVKANQEQNSVLERQGEGRQPDKKAPVAPLGLSDAFGQLQRRI
jgi:hypothetical protein